MPYLVLACVVCVFIFCHVLLWWMGRKHQAALAWTRPVAGAYTILVAVYSLMIAAEVIPAHATSKEILSISWDSIVLFGSLSALIIISTLDSFFFLKHDV